jgi:hypothetical protein
MTWIASQISSTLVSEVGEEVDVEGEEEVDGKKAASTLYVKNRISDGR